MKEKIELTKLELRELGKEKIEEIFELEEKAMNTSTTYPWKKEELLDVFKKNEYFVFGYFWKNQLISKVGFVKVLDNGDLWWELDIATDPNFQGRGVGKKIIVEAIERFGKDKNIFLKVHPNNPALKLYQKVGFLEYKREETEHGLRIIMDYKK